ncbi:helix-turn-helix domain-containing protein [Micromonospora sp. NPDC048169]|uniref:helix-turn-helix domain-containing protein n=1 Tax=Micromonospora sp. NPDC048169 TaxID=3154711 RepID=UPI0033EC3224
MVAEESNPRSRPYRGWKPELHAQALALRRAGCPVGEIARALDVSKSTAYLWIRHLPLDPELVRRRRRIAQRARADAQWSAHRAARDAVRAEVVAASAEWVRQIDRRELMLIGAAIYWCEGGKAKPWRPNDCRIKFVNSDPLLVMLFLRFLDVVEVPAEEPEVPGEHPRDGGRRGRGALVGGSGGRAGGELSAHHDQEASTADHAQEQGRRLPRLPDRAGRRRGPALLEDRRDHERNER